MRRLLGAFFIFILVSCSENTKVPGDIIPPQKMEKVFWDMVQADRFAESFLIREKDTTKRKKETLELYEKVFRLHGITRQEFNKSYTFYMSRPDLTKSMFDSIAVQGERKKNEIFTLKLKADSLLRQNKMDSAKLKLSIDSLKLVKKDSLIRFRKDSLATRRKNGVKPFREDSLRRLRKRSINLLKKDSVTLPAIN